MKRTLLILSILAGGYSASAQCTPDPTVTSGIAPDTATGMSVSYVGQPYSEVFTFVVPLDTVHPTFGTVTITYVKLDDVIGLPANYDYACNPANCEFPGGTTKCVDLYSVTDPVVGQVGSYPVTILATPYVNFGFGDVSAGQTTYDGYFLVIEDQASASISKVEKGEMVSLTAYPNPTSGQTTIEFGMGYSSEVIFTITNLLGEVVNTKKISATKGLHIINVNASNISNGIYL